MQLVIQKFGRSGEDHTQLSGQIPRFALNNRTSVWDLFQPLVPQVSNRILVVQLVMQQFGRSAEDRMQLSGTRKQARNKTILLMIIY